MANEHKWPLVDERTWGIETSFRMLLRAAAAKELTLTFWLPGDGQTVDGTPVRVGEDSVIVKKMETDRMCVIPLYKIEYVSERTVYSNGPTNQPKDGESE